MTEDSEGLHEVANTADSSRKADIGFVHGLGGRTISTSCGALRSVVGLAIGHTHLPRPGTADTSVLGRSGCHPGVISALACLERGIEARFV